MFVLIPERSQLFMHGGASALHVGEFEEPGDGRQEAIDPLPLHLAREDDHLISHPLEALPHLFHGKGRPYRDLFRCTAQEIHMQGHIHFFLREEDPEDVIKNRGGWCTGGIGIQPFLELLVPCPLCSWAESPLLRLS